MFSVLLLEALGRDRHKLTCKGTKDIWQMQTSEWGIVRLHVGEREEINKGHKTGMLEIKPNISGREMN